MAQNNVIVRFPPSPTGLLHVGNVRTALYNYLFAKKNGGKFLIRIEDTDRARSKKEYEENMFESMKWLGLTHDNIGVEWRQTERLDVHKRYLDLLIKSGAAYISEESEGENREVVRFKNPGGKIKFQDLIRGEVEIDVSDLNDFIIARNINEPLYHLAVVIDDLESGITHIIRGEDHVSNTPRQILIWKAIAEASNTPCNLPKYAHLPMILAPDKSKLSKRKHGESVSLKYYQDKSYDPKAIINFMALIGWNPGGEQEIFSLEELINLFDLNKVQKKGAIFNVEKLDWINKQYIAKEPLDFQISNFKDQISKSKWRDSTKFEDDEFLNKLMKIMIDRIHRWGEVSEILDSGEYDYLFETPTLDSDKILWRGESREEGIKHLNSALDILSKNQNTNEELLQYAEREGKGNVLWPLRYALSGKDKSPDPLTLLEILGTVESEKRIRTAITELG